MKHRARSFMVTVAAVTCLVGGVAIACLVGEVAIAQDKPTDNRAIKGMSKVVRMTGSSCVKRPLCPSVRPFFIVLSSAS